MRVPLALLGCACRRCHSSCNRGSVLVDQTDQSRYSPSPWILSTVRAAPFECSSAGISFACANRGWRDQVGSRLLAVLRRRPFPLNFPTLKHFSVGTTRLAVPDPGCEATWSRCFTCRLMFGSSIRRALISVKRIALKSICGFCR
jgi:hypothetical protein